MPSLVGEKRDGQVRSRTASGRVVFEQDYHFTVEADSKYQNRFDLLATPGLPVAYTTIFNGMMCKSVNLVRNVDKAVYWDAVATFSSDVVEGVAPATPQQGDPTSWIPYGKVTFEPYEEVLRNDLDGVPVVNSAGQKFDRSFSRTRRIASLQFTQFEPLGNATIDDIMERSDTMNEEVFLGKPKYTLLLQVDEAEVGLYYGIRCWKVTYTLNYKPWPATGGGLNGGWHMQVADVGYGAWKDAATVTQVGSTHIYEAADNSDFEAFDDGLLHWLDEGKRAAPGVRNLIAFRDHELLDFNSFLRIQKY